MPFTGQNAVIQTLCPAIVVAIMGLGFIAFVLGLPPFRRPKDKRLIERGASGKIVAVGERVRRSAYNLKGKGTFASDTLTFDEGIYKAVYHFPDDVKTAVHLISADTGDDEILFVKSGEGSAAVRVETYGHYVVQVEPADDHAAWSLDIMPLGFQ